jgi:transposase
MMEDLNLKISRLDHLGIVASTVKDLDIIEMINSRIGTSKQEVISTGEAAAGMVYNGLGFTSEALYLSPHFFEDKALDVIFERDDIEPKNFNADKLGNSLDAMHAYGLENLFFEIALESCLKAGVDINFKSLDTTSISLEGAYNTIDDEQAIHVTKGFSKDKRSDLKQVVHELLVTQDGGIPLISKTWSGNANDSTIFKERASKLITQFGNTEFLDVLIADSKLYSESNAVNLSNINFITRIPNSIKECVAHIDLALQDSEWATLDEENKYKSYKLIHYGMEQRWIVIYSQAAHARAQKSVLKKINTELTNIKSKIKEINKQHFGCKEDITKVITSFLKKCKFHAVTYGIEEKEEKAKSKQKSKDVMKYYSVNIIDVVLNQDIKNQYIERKSCYVVGSNVATSSLSNTDVITRYKAQNKSIENMGFRFMKDADMFTSSLFVKTPSRIEALLFIMTLSLLIYSISQRKLRLALENQEESIPNQLNQPTQQPTLKWVFKLLKGINVAVVKIGDVNKVIYEGISAIKEKIINLFGKSARKIYGFQI